MPRMDFPLSLTRKMEEFPPSHLLGQALTMWHLASQPLGKLGTARLSSSGPSENTHFLASVSL